MDFFSKGIFSIVYGEVTGTRLTFLHLKIIKLANCFRLLQQATQYIVLKRREIHQVSATSAQLPPGYILLTMVQKCGSYADNSGLTELRVQRSKLGLQK